MKKIISLLFILPVILSGCKIKEYTPEIPSAFEQNAVVSSGDFSYDCVICRNNAAVTVTITSTYAQDMVMTYDGNAVTFLYNDFSYDIDGENFDSSNCAVIVYEVFDYIDKAYKADNLNVKRIDSGFKYEGDVAAGKFVLVQNDDCSLNSLSFKNNDFTVTFS